MFACTALYVLWMDGWRDGGMDGSDQLPKPSCLPRRKGKDTSKYKSKCTTSSDHTCTCLAPSLPPALVAGNFTLHAVVAHPRKAAQRIAAQRSQSQEKAPFQTLPQTKKPNSVHHPIKLPQPDPTTQIQLTCSAGGTTCRIPVQFTRKSFVPSARPPALSLAGAVTRPWPWSRNSLL
jgi:hypothetical protein